MFKFKKLSYEDKKKEELIAFYKKFSIHSLIMINERIYPIFRGLIKMKISIIYNENSYNRKYKLEVNGFDIGGCQLKTSFLFQAIDEIFDSVLSIDNVKLIYHTLNLFIDKELSKRIKKYPESKKRYETYGNGYFYILEKREIKKEYDRLIDGEDGEDEKLYKDFLEFIENNKAPIEKIYLNVEEFKNTESKIKNI